MDAVRDSGRGGIAGDVVDVVDVRGVEADVGDAPACSQGFGGDAIVTVMMCKWLEVTCIKCWVRQSAALMTGKKPYELCGE